MGIILGLAASIGWGTGDFLVRNTTRRIGSFLSLFYMQVFGLAFVGAWAVLAGELAHFQEMLDPGMALVLGLLAAISVVGTLMLYKAFSIGMLSIVSPIASSFAAVTLVLATLSGERLTPIRTIGVLAALTGVVLSSIEHRPAGDAGALQDKRQWRPPPGVLFAIGAALIYGLIFWIQGFYVIPRIGGPASVLGMRIGAVILLCALLVIGKRSARLPDRRTAWTLVAVGVIDTAAFIATSIGLTTEQVSIVTVLSSLASLWAVLLAWIFLKERPNRLQWTGIALIMFGIVLVSAGA